MSARKTIRDVIADLEAVALLVDDDAPVVVWDERECQYISPKPRRREGVRVDNTGTYPPVFEPEVVIL